MTYKDFPIYIGYGNTDFISDWGYYRKFMLFADSVNVTNNSRATPKRTIGSNVDPDDQFHFPADSVCNIGFSFNFYSKPINNEEGENVYSFLMEGSSYVGNVIGNGTGTNYFPIRIGGNVYNRCYLSDYTVNVNAYEPVKCSVNFISYDPPENVSTKADRGVNFGDYNDSMEGRSVITANTCTLSGVYNNIVSADIVPTFSFSKKYARTPVYTLGSPRPTNFLLDAVESQMKIESTGINNLFDYSGIKLEEAIKLDIKDIDGQEIIPDYFGGFELVCNSGARVNSSSYSIRNQA